MSTTISAGTYNPMLPLIARIFMGSLFLVAGIRKLMGIAGTVGYLTKLGFPAADMLVYLAIAIEIIGSILLIIGWRTRLVAWLMIAFVLVATFAAHRFWEFEAAQMANQMNHFLKNFAVIGGLLMVIAFGPGRASVDRA